jgi:hypothetical protein
MTRARPAAAQPPLTKINSMNGDQWLVVAGLAAVSVLVLTAPALWSRLPDSDTAVIWRARGRRFRRHTRTVTFSDPGRVESTRTLGPTGSTPGSMS